MSDVCIVTCTGDRPMAFELCQKYIARQTFKAEITWRVVDDGQKEVRFTEPMPDNITFEHIRLKPCRNRVTSFRRNMKFGLSKVPAPAVIIMEDDEWYGPRWVEIMYAGLQKAELCGERRALYYNVRLRLFRRWNNRKHASMCQTAFRSSIIDKFQDRMQKVGTVMLDRVLWKMRVRKKLIDPFHQCVGIKGMPGRSGIGTGHRPKARIYRRDQDGSALIKILGKEDAAPYLALYDPKKGKLRR